MALACPRSRPSGSGEGCGRDGRRLRALAGLAVLGLAVVTAAYVPGSWAAFVAAAAFVLMRAVRLLAQRNSTRAAPSGPAYFHLAD